MIKRILPWVGFVVCMVAGEVLGLWLWPPRNNGPVPDLDCPAGTVAKRYEADRWCEREDVQPPPSALQCKEIPSARAEALDCPAGMVEMRSTHYRWCGRECASCQCTVDASHPNEAEIIAIQRQYPLCADGYEVGTPPCIKRQPADGGGTP